MGVWCRLDAGLDVAWGVDLIRHGGVDMFPVLCYIAPRLTHKDVAQIALAKTVQCRQGNWLLIEKDNGVAGLVFHGCMSGRLVMMVELCVERPLDRSRLAHQKLNKISNLDSFLLSLTTCCHTGRARNG